MILGLRRLIGWQLIVRNRLHTPKRVEQDYLAGLIGSRNLLCVIQGFAPRGKTPALALQINDIPCAMFAGNNMYRAPCIDQHATILLLFKRALAEITKTDEA